MAIVEKPFSFRGSAARGTKRSVTYKGFRGRIVASRWPSPRPRPIPPSQQRWIDHFVALSKSSKDQAAGATDWAKELAANSGWFYRDVLEAAAVNKVFRIDGRVPVKTPSASVFKATPTAVPANTDAVLAPDAFLWDNNRFWTPTTDPSRLTFRSAGLYMVVAQVTWLQGTSGWRSLKLRKDGTDIQAAVTASVTNTFAPIQQVNTIAYFNANTYLEVIARTATTGMTATLDRLEAVGITPEVLIP